VYSEYVFNRFGLVVLKALASQMIGNQVFGTTSFAGSNDNSVFVGNP
jgi:hypothetical protein